MASEGWLSRVFWSASSKSFGVAGRIVIRRSSGRIGRLELQM
jgi:hypothetical protein